MSLGDCVRILSSAEVLLVVDSLKRTWLGKCRSRNKHMDLIIFRLGSGCGLRISEIRSLQMRDLQFEGDRPAVRIRAEATKRTAKVKGKEGKKGVGRYVPLWWDKRNRNDLLEWYRIREKEGAGPTDWFVCTKKGEQLSRHNAMRRWRTALSVLGPTRRQQLSSHTGRRSFASHALARGRNLVEVQHALGHADAKMTSKYLYLLESEGVPDLYG